MMQSKHIQQTIEEHNKYQCPDCKRYSLHVYSLNTAFCDEGCEVHDSETIVELLESENYNGCFDPWEIMFG